MLFNNADNHQDSSGQNKIIIIGSGPVGVRMASEILKYNPQASVHLFGNEPFEPYNRVQLTAVLAGDIDRNNILLDVPSKNNYPNFNYTIVKVTRIKPESKIIIDALGEKHSYEKLIIATGSRAFIPNIEGVKKRGVYTFRNLKDTDSLFARISSAKHVVVVGAGLLGIEAAKALRRFNTQVTLIHQSDRVMNRQLDEEAASRLEEKIKALGIEVITQAGVREILGEERVKDVVLRNGKTISCDSVVFCTGITLNTELAFEAKLKVGRGIIVNEQLQTSDHSIYAVGECTEYAGQTYGLVAPGLDQAAILADVLMGGDSKYVGSQSVARLKVVGEDVFSMGEVNEFSRHDRHKEYVFRDNKQGIYRKLMSYKGRLVGAVAIGEWPEEPRIQEAFLNQKKLWPWQFQWFLLTGKLWAKQQSDNVNLWPKAAVVCQCNKITQGELVEAIDSGCNTMSALGSETRAGTVCGSCKPLLQQLLAFDGPLEKETTSMMIMMASIMAMIIVFCMLMIPALQVSDSVQTQPLFEKIWNDKFWKQVTGFSLLGLSLIGLLMSIRKKLASKRWGSFAYWRVFHLCLGVSCAFTLIAHTGFHLGSNLNQWLMIDFLLVLSLGAIAGLVISLSHKMSLDTGNRWRKTLSWLHILVTWPLPMLLAAHILSVYYF